MKRVWIWLLATALCVCAFGCVPVVEVSQPEVSQPEIPTVLGRLPDDLITAAVVSAATGSRMEPGVVEEEGSSLTFYAADGFDKVMFSEQQCSRHYFDDFLSVYYEGMANSQMLDDIGERGVWSPDTCELLAFQNGYFVSVWIYLEERSEADCLQAARGLMTVMLLNLQLTDK